MSIHNNCITLILTCLAAAAGEAYAQGTDTLGAALPQTRDTAVADSINTDTLTHSIPVRCSTDFSAPNPPVAQGVLVISDNPDCEVLINGTKKGKGEKVFIALPTGTYTVSGHLEVGFDDYERVTVSLAEVETVTVQPKMLRVKVDLPSYFALISGQRTLQGLGIGAGVWYGNHLINPFIATCGGSGWEKPENDSLIIREYRSTTAFTFGANYLYNAISNTILQFGLGVTAAWGMQIQSLDSVERNTNVSNGGSDFGWSPMSDTDQSDQPTYHTSTFFSLGPRIAVQAGLEHIKLHVAGTYLVRTDTQGVVADPRNFYLLQAGITLLF